MTSSYFELSTLHLKVPRPHLEPRGVLAATLIEFVVVLLCTSGLNLHMIVLEAEFHFCNFNSEVNTSDFFLASN